jgi:Arc/MetJ-type ribon-helix-helix transcriptional regulator
MGISLSTETQKLLEDRMQRDGFDTADDLVRVALEALDQARAEDYDELDAETRAAIEEAEAQHERGEGVPWEQFKETLRARFVK